MKKSKGSVSSKRKERSRSPLEESKSKRVKPRSKSKEKEKVKEETKSAPRKTRWQAAEVAAVGKSVPLGEPEARPVEQSEPPPRIRDFLHDKEKIVDLLFETVTGAALEELIPDYLKNRSKKELKKLCIEQIKYMKDEDILQVISGKVDSSNKDEEKNVGKEQILKPQQPSPTEVKVKVEKEEATGIKMAEDVPRDAPKSPKISGKEIGSGSEEENLIPLVIKDEVAKDLIQPERDAELLELEMRARAIRSLLKSKTQSVNEEEIKGD